jgi:hypothetical protein
MMTTASFSSGLIVPVCEKHHFQHIENAEAEENMRRAETAARAACEEANHHSWQAFVLRNIADEHIEAYHKARRTLK